MRKEQRCCRRERFAVETEKKLADVIIEQLQEIHRFREEYAQRQFRPPLERPSDVGRIAAHSPRRPLTTPGIMTRHPSRRQTLAASLAAAASLPFARAASGDLVTTG